jgi:hypothetical protein
MPSNFKSVGLTLRLFFSILLVVTLSACAATSTTIIDEEVVTNPKPMYTYKSLVIRDFDLKREMYTDATDADMGRRESRYAQIPGELSGHIERYVKARRIYRSVSRDGQVTESTLVVSGRFTRLGRFRISVVVSLLDGATCQEVAYFRQTLWDVIDTTGTINNLGREVANFIDRIQYK